MWRQILRILLVPLKLLFGYDVFISYRRLDGSEYAAALMSKMSVKVAPRADLQDTDPGVRLPPRLRIDVALSKVLVIVSTPGANESSSVADEVRLYSRFGGGPIVPIEVTYPPQAAEWYQYCQGVPALTESDEARAALAPSDRVVSRIINNVGFWRRSRRQVALTVSFGIVLLALAVVGKEQNSLAESRRLDQLAREAAANSRLAAEYALKALETAPTPEARKAAAAALELLINRRERVSLVNVDATGQFAAVAHYLGAGLVMDLADGRSFTLCGYPEAIKSLEFSHSGRFLAAWRQSGGQDEYVVEIWDVKEGKRKGSVDVGYSQLAGLHFFPDDSRLFIYGIYGSPSLLLEVPSAAVARNLAASEADALNKSFPLDELQTRGRPDVAGRFQIGAKTLPKLAPNGCWATLDHKREHALCAENLMPFVFDRGAGKAVPLSGWGEQRPFIFSVEFSPDDGLVAIGSDKPDAGTSGRETYNTSISMWDAVTGKRLWEHAFPGIGKEMFFAQRGPGRLVVWWERRGPDGYVDAFVASFIEAETGRIISDLSQDDVLHYREYSDQEFSRILWIDPGGYRTIIRTNHALCLWDVDNSKVLRQIDLNSREKELVRADALMLLQDPSAKQLADALRRRLRECQ